MCSTAARGTQVSGVEPLDKTRSHNAINKGIMGSVAKDANRGSHQELYPQKVINGK